MPNRMQWMSRWQIAYAMGKTKQKMEISHIMEMLMISIDGSECSLTFSGQTIHCYAYEILLKYGWLNFSWLSLCLDSLLNMFTYQNRPYLIERLFEYVRIHIQIWTNIHIDMDNYCKLMGCCSSILHKQLWLESAIYIYTNHRYA